MEITSSLAAPRILVVDDQEDLALSLADLIREEFSDAAVQHSSSFQEASEMLRTGNWDLAILDLVDESDGDQKNRGDEVYRQVSETAWTPVVFYTARPTESQHADNPPLVQTIAKTRDQGTLIEAIGVALASGVPQVARALSSEIESRVRTFLRDTVLPRSSEYPFGDRSIQAILQARLAEHLRADLGSLVGSPPLSSADALDDATSLVFYLYPPVAPQLTTGDVVRSGEDWYVVGTPACDLVDEPSRPAKARGVRLFRCHAAFGHPFLQRSTRDRVAQILRGDAGFFHLPRFLDIPEMLADFEGASIQDLSTVQGMERVATIASPFTEKMLHEHGRHVSRVGVPDFNRTELTARLRNQPSANPTAVEGSS